MKHIVLWAVLTAVFAVPAHATLLTRTFVSSAGSDSNPCTVTQPCATFAAAYAAVAPNGIVAALDPGKYGPVNITGPVTINGNGWAAITAPANGRGIIISAAAGDKITLSGLNIDGADAAAGGIWFQSGGSIIITDCVVQNIHYNGSTNTTGDGILIAPTGGTVEFAVTNTTVVNNGFVGLYYLPPPGATPNVKGVIDHVVAMANQFGIAVNPINSAGGSTVATISNSIASNNSGSGIYFAKGPGSYDLSIDNVSASGNGTGIDGHGATQAVLGRSVITGNDIGISNMTSPNTFYSYQNNQIDLNATDIDNALNTKTLH